MSDFEKYLLLIACASVCCLIAIHIAFSEIPLRKMRQKYKVNP